MLVTIRPDLLLARAARESGPGLTACLADTDTAAACARLVGPLGCEQVDACTAQLKQESVRRTEDAMARRDSEQRLRNIFDTAPIGTEFTGVNGLLQDVNPYFFAACWVTRPQRCSACI